MSTSGLEADVRELKTMLEKAQRPNVRAELERILKKTEAEIRETKWDVIQEAAKKNGTIANTTQVPDSHAAAEKVYAASKTAAAATPAPVRHVVTPVGPWTELTTFALDTGGYDKPLATVDLRLKGIEALPVESVTCDFTESSFDLKIIGYEGKNHRMIKTNLEKDIVPADSNVRVKKNHVIVTLAKVKGQYGYDSWADLCAKGGKRKEKPKSENPQDSIMSMMKDLYDDGDDSMKKVIGEAMYKSQRGEKYEPKLDDIDKINTDPKADGCPDDLM